MNLPQLLRLLILKQTNHLRTAKQVGDCFIISMTDKKSNITHERFMDERGKCNTYTVLH